MMCSEIVERQDLAYDRAHMIRFAVNPNDTWTVG
jgi:hypothetical protein